MMSAEEKDLKKIRDDFTKAIELLKNNKLQESKKIFEKIVNKNMESEFTSIMQVQMRSNVYKEFIDYKLAKKEAKPKNNDELLYDGLLLLNKGKLDKAESYFNDLVSKKYKNPFLNYLFAILHSKKGNNEECIEYLKKSFKDDESLKIPAFNESDFEHLKNNTEFMSLIKIN